MMCDTHGSRAEGWLIPLEQQGQSAVIAAAAAAAPLMTLKILVLFETRSYPDPYGNQYNPKDSGLCDTLSLP